MTNVVQRSLGHTFWTCLHTRDYSEEFVPNFKVKNRESVQLSLHRQNLINTSIGIPMKSIFSSSEPSKCERGKNV